MIFNVTSNQITITDSSSISAFSFRGSKYYHTSGSPPSGAFKATGNSPDELVIPAINDGIRVLTILYAPAEDSPSTVVITDTLDSSGSITQSVYELNGTVTTESSINALSTLVSSKLLDLRNLAKVATLTRISGVEPFDTTYDVDNCDYENKIVDVNITLNSTVIVTSIASGYTFKVGGTNAPSIISPS